METRSLGRTDLRLSEIALGTWGLAEGSYGTVTTPRFDETIRSAIEAGVTTFDVAPHWGDGEGERRVGRWLRETQTEGVVVSRGGARRVDGKLQTTFGVEDLVLDCEGSLERLGREAIDLFLLHHPGDLTFKKDVWREAIDRLTGDGKIIAWGVSVGDAEEARMAINAGAQALCLTHNLLSHQILDDIETDVAVAGCGVLARSPLMYGMLAGNWSTRRKFADGDHRGRRWNQDAFDERIRQVDELRFLVGEAHPDLATAALRFVLGSGGVSAAIVGARSPYQVTAAVEAAASGAPYLDPDDVLRLAKIRDAWAG